MCFSQMKKLRRKGFGGFTKFSWLLSGTGASSSDSKSSAISARHLEEHACECGISCSPRWLRAEGPGLEVAEAFGQEGGPVGCLAVERLVVFQLLSHI